MDKYKIIVTGPFSAGKTTFIKALSNTPVVCTDEKISDGSGDSEKKTTTVGIDFGRVDIDEDLGIYLFGTPGQERFSFIWEDLIRGSLGIMIMIDKSDFRSVLEAKKFIQFYTSRTSIPIVIVANKSDKPNGMSIDMLKKFFNPICDYPIIEASGIDKTTAQDALNTIFFEVISQQAK